MNAPPPGTTLPFPPTPTASVAGYSVAESRHQRRAAPSHLAADAPNILLILLDDVGFGLADTVGGEVHTPSFSRVAEQGLCYNRFHTTSICSPTRAALLTGRNHHRVHSGTIAKRAVDWDGYTGVIGKDTATIAEVLRHYGYRTAAFGKWHNTPANQTTAMGLGRQNSRVQVKVAVGERATGVLYALGGFSGGITLLVDQGYLVHEYNMLIMERYQARSSAPIAAGEHCIEVHTRFDSAQPMSPAHVTLHVDGAAVGEVVVARTVPAAFTASETFGVGVDLGSPVSPDYFDRRPFRFDGTLHEVDVEVFPA